MAIAINNVRARSHADQCDRLRALGIWKTNGSTAVPHKPFFMGSGSCALEFGRFLLGNNLPFNLLGDQHFRRLVEVLAPGVKVPSVRQGSGPLLDAVYAGLPPISTSPPPFFFSAERSSQLRRLEGRLVTISIDGWTSKSGIASVGIGTDNEMWSVTYVCLSSPSLPPRSPQRHWCRLPHWSVHV